MISWRRKSVKIWEFRSRNTEIKNDRLSILQNRLSGKMILSIVKQNMKEEILKHFGGDLYVLDKEGFIFLAAWELFGIACHNVFPGQR